MEEPMPTRRSVPFTRARAVARLLVVLVLPAFVASDGGCSDASPSGAAGVQSERAARAVPVTGVSWLEHLGVTLEQTRMGQMGGSGAPPVTAQREPQPGSGRPFTVSGGDLYRLNCRSCHGPDGRGAPPEINSLVEPVQGASRVLVDQRMRQRGRTLPPEFIATLASQAGQAIRDRLQNGGKKMPAFAHLNNDDVNLLMGYLQLLAKVPEAPAGDARLQEPAVVVGEDLVEGTCHICHGATGPGMHAMMMSGGIPSLASLPEQLRPDAVEAKVIDGQSPMSGMMGMMRGQSRMPVLSYLTPQEVAAADLYLRLYPPR
jgi:mono/diheme cytochrome c family protein